MSRVKLNCAPLNFSLNLLLTCRIVKTRGPNQACEITFQLFVYIKGTVLYIQNLKFKGCEHTKIFMDAGHK